jgi:hypothetical protein
LQISVVVIFYSFYHSVLCVLGQMIYLLISCTFKTKRIYLRNHTKGASFTPELDLSGKILDLSLNMITFLVRFLKRNEFVLHVGVMEVIFARKVDYCRLKTCLQIFWNSSLRSPIYISFSHLGGLMFPPIEYGKYSAMWLLRLIHIGQCASASLARLFTLYAPCCWLVSWCQMLARTCTGNLIYSPSLWVVPAQAPNI